MRSISLLALVLVFAFALFAPVTGCSSLLSALSPSPTPTPAAASSAQKVAACVANTDVT